MIDPFTAFAALKGATEAISGAIKTGKDLSTMSSSIAKWAKAEAGLQNFSYNFKLTGAEQNAEKQIDYVMDVWCTAGQWERLQKEIWSS